MQGGSRRFGFFVMALMGLQVEAETDIPAQTYQAPASCFTGVVARNSDAGDFYLAGADGSASNEANVDIEADSAEYNENGSLQLQGNVLIQRPGYRAQSESAFVDQNNGQADLQGNIRIDSPDLQIRGKTASVNMSTQEALVEDASFLNPRSRLRGEAKEIRQQDQDLVVLKEGSFTTCPPDDESWSIRASEIVLGQERGYGEAWHSRFEILDVPVLYVPYFRFPIDDRRKSGFLYPTFGTSNTGEGLFLSTPYYFNIAPQFDATLTPSYIGGRGLHSELELRHMSYFSETEIGLGYLKRDESFLGEERLAGHRSETGERWGVSFEQTYDFAYLGAPLFGEVDFSEISDNDYLDDLNQGLRIENRDNLDRRASFNYVETYWQMEVLVQQYKNLDDDLPLNEEAFQRLPEINYQAFFYYDDWELDWRSRYVYFYRDPDDLTGTDKAHGSRLRHTPKLSLPLSNSWGYIKPSVSLDHTDYELRAYPPRDNHIARTIPVYELDAGMFLDRDSRHFGNRYLHTLEPRFYYVYSRFEDQTEVPNFDTSSPSFSFQRLYNSNRFSGGDRIADNNRATLGITSRWSDWSSGLDRLVLSLGQVFHYDTRRVSVDVGSDGAVDPSIDSSVTTLGASSRKDSFLLGEVLYRPLPELELQFAATWDARENGTRESVSKLAYRAPKGGPVLNLGHRYREAAVEQTDVSFILPIDERVSILGRWRYDLNQERSIGSLAGIEYNSCCWRFQVLTQQYLTEESNIDNSILFRVQLVGMGGFGADEDSLDDQIPGYKRREDYFQ